jgi:hypothetical protein
VQHYSHQSSVAGNALWVSIAVDVSGLTTKAIFLGAGTNSGTDRAVFTWTGPREITLTTPGENIGSYIVIGDYQAILYAYTAAAAFAFCIFNVGGAGAYNGDGQYIDITRMQIEYCAAGESYSSYIPTTTAAITRAADVMADSIISSIAEPAAGEIEWVSAGTYAVGDLRIRKTTHRVYYCVQASTNRTELPENDPAYWLEKSPTNFAAPFDIYTNTAASAVGSISYAIKPGFANAVALYGVYGTKFTLQVVDGDSGLIIYKNSQSLTVPSGGWYEYFFVAPMFLDRLVFSGLPVRPNAILLITVAAASGIPVGIGMIIAGDFRQLIGDIGARGGTEYGISVEPITSSYINTAADGTVTIVRRTKATDMHANVTLDVANANRALQIVQQVLDVPVAWIAANDLADYRGLNVFGIGSAKMYHNNPATADLEINVKGII